MHQHCLHRLYCPNSSQRPPWALPLLSQGVKALAGRCQGLGVYLHCLVLKAVSASFNTVSSHLMGSEAWAKRWLLTVDGSGRVQVFIAYAEQF